VRLDGFVAVTFTDLLILKITPDGTPVALTKAADPSSIGDGEYAIFRDGAPVSGSEHPEAGVEYTIVIGVRDDGLGDLDPTDGLVLTAPLAVTEKDANPGGNGSDSGGCSGFGALPLLASFGVFGTFGSASLTRKGRKER
jgi:hypothetical protein